MEWLAVSIGLGLVVSLLFTEAFGLSVGGMIVPGYLAMHFGNPATVVMTVFAALLTWTAVRFVSQHAIVFGRRRVVLTMLLGFAIGETLRQAMTFSAAWLAAPEMAADAGEPAATVIGFVIPGLIALWIDRTSVLQTLSPLFAASGLVHFALILVGLGS